jgi:osmoprotectant transport system ATP-binding protein
LSNVSFEVEEGEMVVIIGPSGSGKSTILKLLNGLLNPDSGEVFVFGKSIAESDRVALRRRIGFVLQKASLFPHYNVRQNISVVPDLLGWPKDQARKRAQDLLEIMNLPPEEYLDRYPSQLSGGQSQRVGIARALAADPDLCLYDEPFSALDPITRTELQDEILRLKDQLGKTSVFVTHDIREAFKLGDRVIILNEGRIEQVGTPEEIQTNPSSDFVSQFIMLDHG